ncbi:hypothetical protein GCM10009564_11820 [Streptomyces thermogriseus]|uniref:Uncharacterized protein n=1 Tax=Streptomyces thermogriseus TaxID=75292 RepID=A0ABP4DCK6_9ACTN
MSSRAAIVRGAAAVILLEARCAADTRGAHGSAHEERGRRAADHHAPRAPLPGGDRSASRRERHRHCHGERFGCRKGTAAVAVSPDGTAFTVTCSDCLAQAGGNSDPTAFRKNCRLNLIVFQGSPDTVF